MSKLNRDWLNQIEELEKTFFLDAKNQHRAGIGWADKAGFRQELPVKVESVSESLDDKIRRLLDQLLQEFNIRRLHSVQVAADLLDPELKSRTIQEKVSLLAELKNGLDRKLDTLSDKHSLSLFQGIDYKIAEWKQRFGDISWEEVVEFRDKGLEKNRAAS